MRDYTFTCEGRTVPVAEMSTADIKYCLGVGFVINHSDHPADNRQAVRDRLILELFIRERNLRGEQ